MLLSSFLGFLVVMSWVDGHKDNLSWDGAADAFKQAATVVCVAFWVLFPIVYFCTIRRSAASLEYERLVREGELKRSRRGPGPSLRRPGDR